MGGKKKWLVVTSVGVLVIQLVWSGTIWDWLGELKVMLGCVRNVRGVKFAMKRVMMYVFSSSHTYPPVLRKGNLELIF